MSDRDIKKLEKLNCRLTMEYKTHKIFLELDRYIGYYDYLSDSSFSWISMGTKALNFDNNIFTSMKGTLESIKLILQHGKINDSYSLTRKYQDNVIINIYASLYLEDNFNSENLIVEKINSWVENKDKLPEYRIMNKYIIDSKRLKSINNLMFIGNYYKNMRQRLNDHTHYNYFTYMLYNDNQMYDMKNNRIKLLSQLSVDIQNIFIKHFIWLFSLKDNYMMASDHMDYLEMGQTPPENSQYWVAPFIQEIFDDIIKKNRHDLANEFKKSTLMELL